MAIVPYAKLGSALGGAVLGLALLSGCGASSGTPTTPQEAVKQDAVTQEGVKNTLPPSTESSQDAVTRQGMSPSGGQTR